MFTDEDEEAVAHPHEDALVVKVVLAGQELNRTFVDGGSSVDILFKQTLDDLQIGDLRFDPVRTSLKGFGGAELIPLGLIDLPLTIGSSPLQKTMMLTWLVVDEPSPYQVIFGRPFNRIAGAVSSTHMQCVKFRVQGGVGVMRGQQQVARSCYATAARESMQITSVDPRAENRLCQQRPNEEMKQVQVNEDDPSRVVRVGTKITDAIFNELHNLLVEYNDIFAWSHEDMLGIDPRIMCHRLAIDKKHKPVRQKRRVFNQERYEAIHDEVDKLLKAGFIREVNYPE